MQTTADVIVTYVMGVYMIAYPVIVMILIAAKKDDDRFASLYETVKMERMQSRINIIVFLARRIIVACTLLMLHE